MENIQFDYLRGFIGREEMEGLEPMARTAHRLLHDRLGAGSEFTGWLDLPANSDKEEVKKVKEWSAKIRDESQAFILIGVGGSYLGARAGIESLNHHFYNNLPTYKRRGPEVYYAGNNLSGSYLLDLLDLLEGKDISVNIISKSGTTMEPALAFRIIREYMDRKYGKGKGKDRIYITTDKSKGGLRDLAEREGFKSFVIPDDIGGRYSIFTAVGLFPMAVTGVDIDELLAGALDGQVEYSNEDIERNYCYQYAIARNILYNRGKDIEILINYQARLQYLAEWWKQLFGESEGKNGKGLFPVSLNFTRDLHSLGQLIQEGKANLFETSLNILESEEKLIIKESKDNSDGLNYLSGKDMEFVNEKAFEGTIDAHCQGGVPNLIINLPRLNEYYFGKLIYFFEKACAISSYLLGVNPFDQPGVEKYKENMLRYLGRPKY